MRSVPHYLARRLPFYYGWVVVTVMGLVTFAAGAFGPGVVGALLHPMSADLGWSPAVLPGALLLGSLLVILVGPVSGRLLDSQGPRMVLTAGSVVMGVCLLVVGVADSLYLFYAAFSIGYAMFTGVSRVAVAATTAQWFVRRRGSASGVSTLAIGLGYILLPIGATVIVGLWSWRVAWIVAGLFSLGIVTPVSWLFLARQPSDIGQEIDGGRDFRRQSEAGRTARQTAESEEQWTLAEAIRTPTLWVLLLALSIQGIATNGILVHLVPHLIDRGFRPEIATLTFTVDGAAFALSGLFWGPLADRLHARYIYALGSLLLIAFVSTLLVASGSWMIPVIGTLGGMGFGGNVLVLRVVFPNFFGRRSAGSVQGFVTPFQVVVSGSGAVLAGFLRDVSGSYTLPFLCFIALMVLAILIMVRVPNPVKGKRARLST